jgi:hypothetical protein
MHGAEAALLANLNRNASKVLVFLANSVGHNCWILGPLGLHLSAANSLLTSMMIAGENTGATEI